MILKGRPRTHGQQLANYLLSPKNDQVRVLDVRGTIAEERSATGLKQSLKEMDELGKMTHAQSPLFHLALNPNGADQLTPDDWKYSVAKAETALGLEGLPRAVVSHVYQGKEHLHVVWSRVNVEDRKCAELSFSNRKLCQAAREIEMELGLTPTIERKRGPEREKQRVLEAQKQQDERATQPRFERDAAIASAWHQAADAADFKQQIEAAGYHLAVGKRGVLVMDASGEAHSISRSVKGIKARDVKEKLADIGDLPTVETLRQFQIDAPQRQRARNTTAQEWGQLAVNSLPQDAVSTSGRDLTPDDALRKLPGPIP